MSREKIFFHNLKNKNQKIKCTDDARKAKTVVMSTVVLLPKVRSISHKVTKRSYKLRPFLKPYTKAGVGWHVRLPFTEGPVCPCELTKKLYA